MPINGFFKSIEDDFLNVTQIFDEDGGYYLSLDEIIEVINLEELSDITFQNIANNDFLIYDSTLEIWTNKSSSEALTSLEITASNEELNYSDISVLGTAESSKVLTFNENGFSKLPNDFKIQFGTDAIMQMYHNGTDSYITNSLGILKIATETSGIAIEIGHSTSEVTFGQNLTANGVIIGHKDNATSFRVKGLAHSNDVANADVNGDVQSYAGIFTNDVFNQASHGGTKNTRFITGGNLGMDVVTQSAHGLHLIAGDGSQSDGEILMASKNGLKINTRVNPYAVTAPKYLQIDRVDKTSLDANNTSNVELSVNSGNLVIASNTDISSLILSSQSNDLNVNSNKIVNLSTPTTDSDAATKSYVDSVAQGLDVKSSVRVATTSSGTLATDFENGDTVDGIVLATGNRILIKDQSTSSENGIYVVAASGSPTRAGDLSDSSSASSIFVFIEEGNINADLGFVCTTDDGSDTVGTDGLVFSQFSGAGQISAGTGLTKSGNSLDVNVDNSSLEIVADAVKVKNGGITSAMLSGSIANSKLNKLTVANKVALSSIDINGAVDLGSISDTDLFIVDNNGAGNNYSATASNIAGYTFGKVSGDATITNTGTLSLSTTSITNQTVKTTINDNDLILLSDSEDNNDLKKMTKANFVAGLVAGGVSADNISTGSSDIGFETSNGTLTLSSTDDIEINNTNTSANINFSLNGVSNSFVLSSTLSSGDYVRQLRFKDGFSLRTLTTLTAEGAGGTGYPGSEIILLGETGTSTQSKSLVIGTEQGVIADAYGNNSDSSVVLQSASRKFIFTDSSKRVDLAGPYPFFHVEKVKGSDSDSNLDFEIEMNATKGVFGSYLGTNWNNFTHSTFLKANQDGQVTKIGHDTPTDGQVLTWDNTNGYAVWESASSVATITDLTDVTSSNPQANQLLKYNGTNWENLSLIESDIPNKGQLPITEISGVSFFSASPGNMYVVSPGSGSSIEARLGHASSYDAGTMLQIYNYGAGKVLLAEGTSGSTINPSDGTNTSFPFYESGRLIESKGLITIIATSTNWRMVITPQLEFKEVDMTTDGQVFSYDSSNSSMIPLPYVLPQVSGTQNYVLTTNGGNAATWSQVNYTNLSNTPTLGSSSAIDVGTNANNVVQLDGNSKLPAVDGSLLTNMHYTYSAKTTSFNAEINYHYSVNTSSSAVNITLPQISNTVAGQQLRIKFKSGTNLLTVLPYSGDTIEDLSSLIMTDSQSPGQSLDLISNGVNSWEII
jgi:hypothetical protein